MAKHFLILIVSLALTGTMSAQLPYSKMLGLNSAELKEKKFKYDSNKNQHKMSKANKTNQTMNVLSAIGGNTADIKPHVDDYEITIQKGAEDKDSFLSIRFYNDDTYHNLLTWLAENDITPLETRSGKLTLQKFNYKDLAVELATEQVSVKTTTGRSAFGAKTIDESYNMYTYTIFTGIAPESKWHTKEAKKKEKDKLKGKKEDLDDLM